MRLAVPFVLFLAATTPRQGCGDGPRPYEPCSEKACGDACTACAPDDRDCVETAVVKACDPYGRCVPQVEGLCAAAKDPCAGQACGAECVIDPPCADADPPCLMPSVLGHCDPGGACIAGDPPPPGFCAPQPPPPPSWGCEGKACGDSCGVCPEGTDPSSCPVPTLAATACDAALQCVTVGTFTCTPAQACEGKACGAACETCPACMRPNAMACDASGACVSGLATCAP